MKRVGNLTDRIAELDNLYLAYCKARRGKQTKKEVIRFSENLDKNLLQLRSEILEGNVDVGHYHFFKIYDPKERLICAASFRERVLHHAIMNVCHPYFDRRLIADTYATRKGKGVFAALDKVEKAVAQCRYVVKLDFRKYYDSISHDVLKHHLQKMFKDKRLLRIFGLIIDSYHVDEGYGLPIGNLTSQYFANTYLAELDHKCKEIWKVKYYVRYMDDIFMADHSKRVLKFCVDKYRAASAELFLNLKPPVFSVSSVGVDFLGYKMVKGCRSLTGRSKRRFRSKYLKYDRNLKNGKWDEATYKEHILPLLSFVMHAETLSFRQSCQNIVGFGREWVEPCEPRW